MDLPDGRAEKRAIENAHQWSLAQGSSNPVWYLGHWGPFYAERLGMSPVVTRSDSSNAKGIGDRSRIAPHIRVRVLRVLSEHIAKSPEIPESP